MALTDSQITRIRNTIGDTVIGDPDISDERLEELFTEYEDDLPATMLAAAYERLGILSNEVDTTDSNTLITEKRNQRFSNLEKVIARLERQTGQSGAALTLGLLRHNLDSRSDEDAL